MYVTAQPGGLVNIPLGLVEHLEQRDLFYIHLYCKDARCYRLGGGGREGEVFQSWALAVFLGALLIQSWAFSVFFSFIQ